MADEEGEVRESSNHFIVDGRHVDAWGNEIEDPDEVAPDNSDYSEWSGKQLQAEVKRRNKDRAEENKIVPDGRSKADFAAALERDDSEEE
jgi:hypothetical protein